MTDPTPETLIELGKEMGGLKNGRTYGNRRAWADRVFKHYYAWEKDIAARQDAENKLAGAKHALDDMRAAFEDAEKRLAAWREYDKAWRLPLYQSVGGVIDVDDEHRSIFDDATRALRALGEDV